VLGRYDESASWFEKGAVKADALGARPASLSARSGLCATLLERGKRGDRARAEALAREVLRSSAELGIQAVRRQPWLAPFV
jgi:hypothetical protein